MNTKELKQAISAFGSPSKRLRLLIVKNALVFGDAELFVKVPCHIPPELLDGDYGASTNVRDVKQALSLADYDMSQIELQLVGSNLYVRANGQFIDWGDASYLGFGFPDLTGFKSINIPYEKAWKAQTFVYTDDDRIMITGVYFDKDCIVATDGHRLVRFPATIESKVQKLNLKMRLSKKLKLTNFYRKDKTVYATNDEQSIVTRMEIDLEYPNYKRVIPDYTKFDKIILNVNELKTACELAKKIWTKDDSINKDTKLDKLRPIIITPKGIAIKKSLYLFNQKSKVKFQPVAFNAQYILDVLKNAGKAETITMYLGSLLSEGSTILLGDDLYVIMPMRFDFDIEVVTEYEFEKSEKEIKSDNKGFGLV